MTEMDSNGESSPSFQAMQMGLRASAGSLNGPSSQHFEALNDADWEELVSGATAQAVAPLLHHVWKEEAGVPPLVQTQLSLAYRVSHLFTHLLFAELVTALTTLAKADIPHLVLKGAALATTIYERPALRPMSDIDLLIAPADALAAIDVLAAIGYRPLHSEVHPETDLRYENEIALAKPNDAHDRLPAVVLELHWSLLDSPFYQQTLAMDWFWQTATPFQVEGVAARMLGVEAQLLHLCAHLALHHRGEGLLWMHDIALLLHKEHVNWRIVFDKSVSLHLILPVRYILGQIAVDWGVPIPSDVLAELHDCDPSPAEARVFAWLMAENRPVARRFGADLRSLPRRQRLGYAWRHLFPSLVYMRRRYGMNNALMAPLFYLYRWYLGLRSLFVSVIVR